MTPVLHLGDLQCFIVVYELRGMREGAQHVSVSATTLTKQPAGAY